MRLENVQIFLERDKVLSDKTLVPFDQQAEGTVRCLRPLDGFALRLAQRRGPGGSQAGQAECRQLKKFPTSMISYPNHFALLAKSDPA
jgi:hypothetical protein